MGAMDDCSDYSGTMNAETPLGYFGMADESGMAWEASPCYELADAFGVAGTALPLPFMQCVATQPVCAAASPGAEVAPPPPPPPREWAPGSAEVPSVGSKGHSVGDCRP